MHPSVATLVAFDDGEAGAEQSRRIAKHLGQCECCRGQMRRIRGEKNELSAGAETPEMEDRHGLAGLLSAMARWRSDPDAAGATELRSRLRWQIETYFGSPAVSAIEFPGMPAEELLGKASEMLGVFLGQAAAEEVRDEVLGGLECARWEE